MKKLDLSKNHIGWKGSEVLSAMDMKYLTSLKLNHCPIGNKGLSRLVRSKWGNLEHL